jgi:hypothetical protein
MATDLRPKPDSLPLAAVLPCHSDVPSQADGARFSVFTWTHREVLALMDRAEEKAGPKDVGEQALMRGFEQSVEPISGRPCFIAKRQITVFRRATSFRIAASAMRNGALTSTRV